MNEIEQKFYDAFCEVADVSLIKKQVPIGIYIADFVIYTNYIVEIDGHEAHKTKEQRYYDYKKERFFMKEGYVVIRYMASEVFVDPEKCAHEAEEVALMHDDKLIESFGEGLEEGRNGK